MPLQDSNNLSDEKSESRLYIGNLDLRISEAALIKMFSPFGKIISEDFLWHTRGPKRGEPRGYAFVQFSTKEEAQQAKEKMHGKLVCGRPLIVRLASEKYLMEGGENSSKAVGGETTKPYLSGGSLTRMSRGAKIAAIKNKLKSMEEESHISKRQKPADSSSRSSND
nr:probable RNA-binding protein 18 isoform X1 [Ipomoea batatas]GME17557.1 probable RNA-binding protein 18 isoform X1 [Ipomoea batatas]